MNQVKFYRGNTVPTGSSTDSNGLYFTNDGKLYDGKTKLIIGEKLTKQSIGNHNGHLMSASSQISGEGYCIAGCKGWYYCAVVVAENAFILSETQLTDPTDTTWWYESKADSPYDSEDWTNVTYDDLNPVGDNLVVVCNQKFETFTLAKHFTTSSGTVVVIVNGSISDSGMNPLDIPETFEQDDYTIRSLQHSEWGSVDLGQGSSAFGRSTQAVAWAAHAEGYLTKAYGNYSHAEGRNTTSYYAAHAEGLDTMALGHQSHAEGSISRALNKCAHAEGYDSEASGWASHAEGRSIASASYSHAEGDLCTASGNFSHAEGNNTETSGKSAHAEGYLSIGRGDYSHSEGHRTRSKGIGSHAEGYNTSAFGEYSHAEGYGLGQGNDNGGAIGNYSHVEGYQTTANGIGAHAEGGNTKATGSYAHAEGLQDKTVQTDTNTLGKYVLATSRTYTGDNPSVPVGAIGASSHVEGYNNTAIGNQAHAEGKLNIADSATAAGAHAEGTNCSAVGWGAHAEGRRCLAGANYAHAQNFDTQALGQGSTSMGRETIASANYSLATGYKTQATGNYSAAFGTGTTTNAENQFVIGRYNTASSSALFAVGNGTSSKRSTVLEVNSSRINITDADLRIYSTSATNHGVGISSSTIWLDPMGSVNSVPFKATGAGVIVNNIESTNTLTANTATITSLKTDFISPTDRYGVKELSYAYSSDGSNSTLSLYEDTLPFILNKNDKVRLVIKLNFLDATYNDEDYLNTVGMQVSSNKTSFLLFDDEIIYSPNNQKPVFCQGNVIFRTANENIAGKLIINDLTLFYFDSNIGVTHNINYSGDIEGLIGDRATLQVEVIPIQRSVLNNGNEIFLPNLMHLTAGKLLAKSFAWEDISTDIYNAYIPISSGFAGVIQLTIIDTEGVDHTTSYKDVVFDDGQFYITLEDNSCHIEAILDYSTKNIHIVFEGSYSPSYVYLRIIPYALL